MIKLKNIFIICWSVWLIDFLLTFIALNYYCCLYEANPFPAKILSIGMLGFPLLLMITTLIIFCMSLFSYFCAWLSVKISGNEEDGFMVSYLLVVVFCVLEFGVILNNLSLLF